MSTFLQETENLKTRLAIWITLKSEADPPKAAWRREPTTEQSSRTLHRPKDAKQKEFLLRETRREIDWLMEFPPNLCLEIQTRLKIKNGGRSHEERNQYLGGGWVGGGGTDYSDYSCRPDAGEEGRVAKGSGGFCLC
jgi:hypothetical protein